MTTKKTRWVPKVGQKYWQCVVSRTERKALSEFWFRQHYENTWEFDINCFRTKREAQKAAKAINKILRG